MTASLADRVLDFGLNVLDTEADKVTICSTEPTTYTEANSTYALGSKTFATGAAVGSPAAGSPNGRKVTTTSITDGVVSGTGTAAHEAIVDTANSRLLADAPLSATQVVTNGNSWARTGYDIRIPGQ